MGLGFLGLGFLVFVEVSWVRFLVLSRDGDNGALRFRLARQP